LELCVIINAMRVHRPESRHSSGCSYRDIATKWLKEMPYHCLHKRGFNTKQLGSQISLAYMRKLFFVRYTMSKNGKKQYWFDWFVQNFPLWTVLTKGNSATHRNSEIMINFDILKALAEVSPIEVYKAWESERVATDTLDYILIDLENLQRYIAQTTESVTMQISGNLKDTMKRNLADALIIEALAIAHNDTEVCNLTGNTLHYLPQTYRVSPEFNRRTYTGSIALQRCHSKVRDACVGKGYQLDLNNSVYAFFKWLGKDHVGIDTSIITELMENKKRFRADIGSVLLNTFDNSKEKKVKKCITALGFGAMDTEFGSLKDILRNSDDLIAFNNHPKVIQLKLLTSQIHKWAKTFYADEIAEIKLRDPDFVTRGNQIKMKKFMAKIYQNYETALMLDLMKFLDSTGNPTVLWVHDGIYLRKKPDGYYNTIIKTKWNPYVSADCEHIESMYYSAPVSSKKADSAHTQRMAVEQMKAEQARYDEGYLTNSKENARTLLRGLRERSKSSEFEENTIGAEDQYLDHYNGYKHYGEEA